MGIFALGGGVDIVDAAPSRWGHTVPRVVRTVPQQHLCDDPHFPRLSGRWLVMCSGSRQPDLALDLHTGRYTELESVAGPAALGPQGLYAVGRDNGLWRLPGPAPSTPDHIRDAVARVGMSATHAAVARVSHIDVVNLGERKRLTYKAQPAPWYAPAIEGERVLWVEHTATGQRIRTLADFGANPETLDEGTWRHHPVLSGDYGAWVADGGLTLVHFPSGQRQHIAADTGFESAPTLHDDYLCWGERSTGTLAVRCVDGFNVPGRRPSGGGPLLAVQRDDYIQVHAASWWPVEAPQDQGDGRGEVLLPMWWGPGVIYAEALIEDVWTVVGSAELSDTPVPISVPVQHPLRLVPEHAFPKGLRT